MRNHQLKVLVLRLAIPLLAAFGCVTPEASKSQSTPSDTALEPTIDNSDGGDEVVGTPHSQVGPYQILTPETVDLLDNGSIKVEFEAPCASLGSDRVIVWSDPSNERLAKVGVLFAQSECRKGGPRSFERTVSPGMSEFVNNLPDQAKVRPMKAGEFRLVPATSVVVEAAKGARLTYAAPCEQISGNQLVSTLEPRSKTLSVGIIFPVSGCKSGASKTFTSQFDTESDEYLALGAGEQDLVTRPMWVQ